MKKVGIMVNIPQDEVDAMRAGMPGGLDLSEVVRRFAKRGLAPAPATPRPALAPAPVAVAPPAPAVRPAPAPKPPAPAPRARSAPAAPRAPAPAKPAKVQLRPPSIKIVKTVVETVEVRGEPVREYLPSGHAVDLVAFLDFGYPLAMEGEMTAGEIVEAWHGEMRTEEAA